MSDPSEESIQLVIRCPTCGQRFKVGEELRGRTVECGACDHRFRVTDEVIVRGKKFYPGERRDRRLMQFQRVPMAISSTLMEMDSVNYADAPDPSAYEPVPPQRVLAGIAAVLAVILMALLLIFGAKNGGALDGMITSKRLIMAGFTAVMAIVLLVYANPRARIKAFAVAFLGGLGLMALPLYFTEGSALLSSTPIEEEQDWFGEAVQKTIEEMPESNVELDALREEIGTKPLEDEMARLQAISDEKRAAGLWLRDMQEQHRFLIKDYLLRTTGATEDSHFYPRGKGDFLLVLSGITLPIDEIARLSNPLGTIQRIYRELDVIEITVNNQNFVEGPIGQLTDRNDPSFYELNKRELESIDLARVSKAVNRLAEAEPSSYRSDITRRLLALLAMPEIDFKGDLCRALAVWSETPGPAGEAALREAGRLLSLNEPVPSDMVDLALKEKTDGLAPLIHQLWELEPNFWELRYSELGAEIEPILVRRLPTATGPHLKSAIRMLGKVGSISCLPQLQSLFVGANSELQILLEQAIASIEQRQIR